jgi:DNA invertase Pin-like site-specific DNA recombinase
MEQKEKMAGYARVSTLDKCQELSLIHQTDWVRDYVQKQPKYEFAGIYADQISGKSADKRKEFNLLLKACRNGEVQMIITKSISRFARNLCETLETVRELRRLGVGIIFDKESINTLDPSSDLKLSLYATFAERELDSLSGNIQWAARKRFKEGHVEFNLMYGYRYLGGKKHEIIPEEAAIVREVFERYIGGEGARTIAVSMNAKGAKKKMGDKPWVSHDILRIITNEKYTGNAILQKTVSDESFKKVKNTGQVQQFYVENNHPAIISQEIFNKANAILDSRKWKRDSVAPFKPRSPLTGKVICGCCGTTYNRRTLHSGCRNHPIAAWECSRYSSSGKASCPDSKMIHDRELKELFLSAYNEAVKGGFESQPVRIDEALRDLLSQERELSALRAKGYIPRQAYQEEQAKLVAQIKELEAEYAELTKRGDGVMKPETEYSDTLTRFLEQATLNGLEITFKFTNGAVIKRAMNSFRRKPKEGK